MEYRRTHTSADLKENETVRLSGWVHRRRDHGGLVFVDLRDIHGITQLVFNPEKIPESQDLRSEWVITVSGKVSKRAEGMENSKLQTGAIEVIVSEMTVLTDAKTPPFSIADPDETHEETRLKWRYLDIRRGKIADNLKKRSEVLQTIRAYLTKQGFFEVQTPILAKSTPEGARDYLVPSRTYAGHFYALPQSPQLFKQLLMISGLERYFQIAPCFRDEDLRADRQPEFTQIDIEMSFEKADGLMALMEKMLVELFPASKTPFPRMNYADALDMYGTDKPDTRFGMPLVNLVDIAKRSSFQVFLEELENNGIVKGLVVKKGSALSRSEIDALIAFAQTFGMKGLAWMKFQNGALESNIVKFFDGSLQKELVQKMNVEEGDLVLMAAGAKHLVNQALDHLRRKLGHDLNLIDHSKLAFLWVTDFPLFEWDPLEKRLNAVHHPFTAPHPDDIPLLETHPEKVRSQAYDLVLNGYEIGGGSERIYSETIQEKIFNILRLSKEDQKSRFGFFLEALKYGTPPHLGIAFGLDRLMMILTNTTNIRDVIAFPKTQKGQDLMLECPSEVALEQLRDLSISIE